jgi:Flp pilus assembly protein TadG
VSVSIFEFGRAYQTWQVLTNAAREGARVAILPNSTTAQIQARVTQYMTDGAIGGVKTATIAVNPNQTVSLGGGTTAKATTVTISYPFNFIVLNPVARLVVGNSTLGAAFTMNISSTMRNEEQ